MRKLLLLLVFFAPLLHATDADPKFIVATQSIEPSKATEDGWRIDTGEIYEFIRFADQQEFDSVKYPPTPRKEILAAIAAKPAASKDKTYLVARMGIVIIIAPTAWFQPVPSEKNEETQKTYEREVDFANAAARRSQ